MVGNCAIVYSPLVTALFPAPAPSALFCDAINYWTLKSQSSTKPFSATSEQHQMNFGRWISKASSNFPQGRCYPLTILDDHSRFAIALQACAREHQEILRKQL